MAGKGVRNVHPALRENARTRILSLGHLYPWDTHSTVGESFGCDDLEKGSIGI